VEGERGFKSWLSPVIQKALVMYHWQPIKWERGILDAAVQCVFLYCLEPVFNKI